VVTRQGSVAGVGLLALFAGACPPDESRPPRGPQVLNVVSAAKDPNGVPLNPRWAFQAVETSGQLPLADPEWQCGGFPTKAEESRRRGDPQCTDQDTSVDVPTGWHKPVCGAEFLSVAHLAAHDQEPSHERVTFIVRYYDPGMALVAAAFYPNDPPVRRYLRR
jgi:hypothetical protein